MFLLRTHHPFIASVCLTTAVAQCVDSQRKDAAKALFPKEKLGAMSLVSAKLGVEYSV